MGSSIWNRFLTAPFRDPLPLFVAIADLPSSRVLYDHTPGARCCSKPPTQLCAQTCRLVLAISESPIRLP